MNPVRLTGNDLSFTDLHEVVYQRRAVLLSGDARQKVSTARAVVDALVGEDKVAYGVTTGVG
jgi:histidine ammonia-lyase